MGDLLAHAPAMRRELTLPERALWVALRRYGLSGWTFRRQYVNGRYIVDFCCPAASPIIEVDGETHADPDLDTKRTAWLEGEGFRVLRSWNNEVMTNLKGVLPVIQSTCGAAPPPPTPLPQGEVESPHDK